MPTKVVAVIASNRAKSLAEFLTAWTPAPWDELIVIEDGPTRSFDLSAVECKTHHSSWAEIEADPDVADGMRFSRRDSAIKLYGFWAALRRGADVVIALDDDCFPAGPPSALVSGHVAALSPRPRWVPSIHWTPTRGLPYFDLGTINGAVANMGLWCEIADYDAPQTLALHRSGKFERRYDPPAGNRLMHPHHYWPFCAMNISFRREIAPLMYMPRMGDGSPYRRFDDIWCGVILQRGCRHLGLSLSAGDPHIRHIRASDPLVNLEKEAPGIRANEEFWKVVEASPLGDEATTPLECVEAIGAHFVGDGMRMVEASNPALSGFIASEGASLRAWATMFRKTGWI